MGHLFYKRERLEGKIGRGWGIFGRIIIKKKELTGND
jgi:hypothetical protein